MKTTTQKVIQPPELNLAGGWVDAWKAWSSCEHTKDHHHAAKVIGKPLSGKTQYECAACGLRWFRG